MGDARPADYGLAGVIMFFTGPDNLKRNAKESPARVSRFVRFVLNCWGNDGPRACRKGDVGPVVFGCVSERTRAVLSDSDGVGRGSLGGVLGPARGSRPIPPMCADRKNGQKCKGRFAWSKGEKGGRGQKFWSDFCAYRCPVVVISPPCKFAPGGSLGRCVSPVMRYDVK